MMESRYRPALTADEIKSYRHNGVVRAGQNPFTESQFAALTELAHKTIEKEFPPGHSGAFFKLFSKHPNFIDFAAENSLLDLVEALIGPDICLMGSCLFLKRAGSPKYASWHSDVGQQFETFENMEILSVTIAITPSTKESGCVRYLPQSHNKIFRRYTTDNYENSLFGSRSFLIEDAEVDLSKGVIDMELMPGQCSMNHLYTVHSSEPNKSGEDRALVNFKYLAPHPENGTAKGRELLKAEVKNRILVRGVDKAGFCNL